MIGYRSCVNVKCVARVTDGPSLLLRLPKFVLILVYPLRLPRTSRLPSTCALNVLMRFIENIRTRCSMIFCIRCSKCRCPARTRAADLRTKVSSPCVSLPSAPVTTAIVLSDTVASATTRVTITREVVIILFTPVCPVRGI
uniref:Uncharacterized protein n=1 Tax=Cacopsylla melanoneura TaxID=428564 RepID=A0A8D8RT80_9HEMI